MRLRRSSDSLTVSEANRRLFGEIARVHDTSEECVVDARFQETLRTTLRTALSRLPESPRVLDACGGSGNASLVLLDQGVQPVTVDITPEMLDLYRTKASAMGFEAQTVVSDISEFLSEDERLWDLIVFSAALHHFEDYEYVFAQAMAKLTPGGILVDIFEPAAVNRLGALLRRLEYILHVGLRTPTRVGTILRDRLSDARSCFGSQARNSVRTLSAVAEPHGLRGLDDLRLRARLEASRFAVLVHEREYDGRFRLTRVLFRLIQQPSSFRFVAQAPYHVIAEPTTPESGGAPP